MTTTMRLFELRQNGTPVFRGPRVSCLHKLHACQAHSIHYAIHKDGWRLKELCDLTETERRAIIESDPYQIITVTAVKDIDMAFNSVEVRLASGEHRLLPYMYSFGLRRAGDKADISKSFLIPLKK